MVGEKKMAVIIFMEYLLCARQYSLSHLTQQTIQWGGCQLNILFSDEETEREDKFKQGHTAGK